MTPSVKVLAFEAINAVEPNAAQEFNRRFFHPDRMSVTDELLLNDINSFWRIQLSHLPGNTLIARSALRNDVSIERWVVMFIHDVVPCIVEQWYPSLQGGTDE